MNPRIQNVKTKNYRRHLARLASLVVLSITALAAQGQTVERQPLAVSQLAGSWTATLVGNTGCAFTSMLVTFTLDSAGTGTATITANSSSANPGCGPGVNNGQTFAINTLNADGSGTANLTCGPDCGWEFNIQLAPHREIFNLVDVVNDGNYLAGTAVRQP
jgi:hypothetical protein